MSSVAFVFRGTLPAIRSSPRPNGLSARQRIKSGLLINILASPTRLRCPPDSSLIRWLCLSTLSSDKFVSLACHSPMRRERPFAGWVLREPMRRCPSRLARMFWLISRSGSPSWTLLQTRNFPGWVRVLVRIPIEMSFYGRSRNPCPRSLCPQWYVTGWIFPIRSWQLELPFDFCRFQKLYFQTGVVPQKRLLRFSTCKKLIME